MHDPPIDIKENKIYQIYDPRIDIKINIIKLWSTVDATVVFGMSEFNLQYKI